MDIWLKHDSNNVALTEKCKNECESVGVCEQIREMCNWRDRCGMALFNKEECSTIIECLCTG